MLSAILIMAVALILVLVELHWRQVSSQLQHLSQQQQRQHQQLKRLQQQGQQLKQHLQQAAIAPKPNRNNVIALPLLAAPCNRKHKLRLALKHHPDRGGSHQEMVEINNH